MSNDNKQIAVVRIYYNKHTGYVSAAIDANGEEREVVGAPNMEILLGWVEMHLSSLEDVYDNARPS